MIKTEHGPGLRTLCLLKDLQIGIKNYHAEYERWPVPDSRDDYFAITRGSLIRCLLGEASEGNFRQVRFIDVSVAIGGKRGIMHDNTGEPWILDEWGRPVYVSIDTNHDERMSMPDGVKDPPKHLPVAVALFSAGPDGIPGNADDVTTWR